MGVGDKTLSRAVGTRKDSWAVLLGKFIASGLTAARTFTLPDASGTIALTTDTPTGIIHPWAGRTAPAGFLLADGSAVSRSTYAALFNVLVPSVGTATVTIASPAVVTLASHGFAINDTIYFTTTGALPTGLSANTLYYIISTGFTASTFQVSATYKGPAVNTSGSQSGTHTVRACPYGLGDGSTTFNVPDTLGRALVGAGAGASLTARTAGRKDGLETVVLTTSEIPAHTHTYTSTGATGNYAGGGSSVGPAFTFGNATGSAGTGGAHENMQPYLVVNWIIKT